MRYNGTLIVTETIIRHLV